MKQQEFNEKLARQELLILLKNAKSGNESALTALEVHLKIIKSYVKAVEANDDFTEILIDTEGDFSQILNDAGFRDTPGPKPCKSHELFELVLKYCCPLNENIEVVLARNEFIPLTVTKKLEKSTFSWEEEGTTQTLARITKDADLLTRLSKSKENSTRYEVAANIHTPVEVLSKLAKDQDISDSLWYCSIGMPLSLIQFAVISNASTPRLVLESVIAGKHRLSADKFEKVHGFGLYNAEDEEELNEAVAIRARLSLKSAKKA